MAKRINPGDLAKWAEREIIPPLEQKFNRFIKFAATSLPMESPQYTGFYASSWKTSLQIPRPTETYQNLKKFGYSPKEPWYSIGLKLREEGKGSAPPHVSPRFEIPIFKLKDTVYIANTAVYSIYALGQKPPVTTKYGGIWPFVNSLQESAPDFFGSDLSVKVMT